MTQWLRAHWMILTVAVSCLVVGAMIGGTSSPEATTVTKTELKTVHDTKTVTEQVTPLSCVKTINVLATTNRTTMDIAGKAVLAASRNDAAGINAQTARLGGITKQIKGVMPEFNACMDKAS